MAAEVVAKPVAATRQAQEPWPTVSAEQPVTSEHWPAWVPERRQPAPAELERAASPPAAHAVAHAAASGPGQSGPPPQPVRARAMWAANEMTQRWRRPVETAPRRMQQAALPV